MLAEQASQTVSALVVQAAEIFVPGWQEEHAEQLAEPPDAENVVPAEQDKQSEASTAGEYLPAGQAWHMVEPETGTE